MKRHEYREMKFWKSLTNNDYGIVAPLDQKKMANLIECMIFCGHCINLIKNGLLHIF